MAQDSALLGGLSLVIECLEFGIPIETNNGLITILQSDEEKIVFNLKHLSSRAVYFASQFMKFNQSRNCADIADFGEAVSNMANDILSKSKCEFEGDMNSMEELENFANRIEYELITYLFRYGNINCMEKYAVMGMMFFDFILVCYNACIVCEFLCEKCRNRRHESL